MAQTPTPRERFCELLRSTGRENIEYVIEDLDAYGFFEAPASVRNHFNYAGGLVDHSLSVYDAAVMLREGLIKKRPDLEAKLPMDSVIIASLLHDTCKANIYRLVRRKRKNEIGVWEETEQYEVDYSGLPMGHGEKSVVMLLRSGLDLEDDEILAIRWHMGPGLSTTPRSSRTRAIVRPWRRLPSFRSFTPPTPSRRSSSSAIRFSPDFHSLSP